MPQNSETGSIIVLAALIRERANARISEALAGFGVTDILPAHGAVLRALFQRGSMPMSALASAIGRKKNTVTSLINTLEALGYCRREAHGQDARVQLVALTDKGEAMRDIQAKVSAELLHRVWAGIPEREGRACIETLRAVLRNLESN